MLTDIFAERYAARVLWHEYTEAEARLLTQCYQLIAEDLIPYWQDGKVSDSGKAAWQSIHDRLRRELGLKELAPMYFSYQTTHMGKPHTMSGALTLNMVCKSFMEARYSGVVSPDRFIKERLSLVELAFRLREEMLLTTLANNLSARIAAAALAAKLRTIPGGSTTNTVTNWDQKLKDAFQASVDELNERFRRAATKLNYHNGFIQIVTDEVLEARLEKPFWALVANDDWKNVDTDMKEAVDRRDTGGRDPAFYAARALESTIKIISNKKGWTRGDEKGAHGYIDNLGSVKNGRFVADWERGALKAFFSEVRNPLGHGPGDEEILKLSDAQTDWAIETSMAWIKSLISRM